jgi:hypothetical protein
MIHSGQTFCFESRYKGRKVSLTLAREGDGFLLVQITRKGSRTRGDRLDPGRATELRNWLRFEAPFGEPRKLCGGLGGTLTIRDVAITLPPKVRNQAVAWLDGDD